jgi:tight adherence protein B
VGVLVGLLLGLGLLLVWSAFVLPPRDPRPDAVRRSRLRDQLARAGMPSVTPAMLLCASAVVALLAFVAVYAVSRTAPVAGMFGLLAGYGPFALVAGRARRRQRELAEVWPEAVDHLASGVRAGLSLAEAVSGLSDRGPESLRPAFARFAREYQMSGRFEECLDRLKEHLADPVGDRVVEGLRVAREVGGGDLGRLLRGLSGHLRDDARTRSELEARQSWAVNGARLAVASPWLVLLLMCFQPEVIARYSSTAGVVVLGVGAALCLLAYRVMLRIGRLPIERRVLGEGAP